MKTNDDLKARARLATSPEFIERVVRPALCRRTPDIPVSRECETSVALDRGTGRLTLGYDFADGHLVFGKLYSDDLGPYSARLLEELWQSGFGDGQAHQVSEPLEYFPEHNLLLTRAATGTCLLSMVGRDDPELLSRVRRTARWLVQFHRCDVRAGSRQTPWESLKLVRILRRITKATARARHQRKRLIAMVKRLCEKGEEGIEQAPCVQTHGRYHYEHVFVSPETVTLIDFDRACPADPARDLAEFVNLLRQRTFKRTGSVARAEEPTRVFLHEYLSRLPENGKNLPVYWGAFLFLSMFQYVKKQETEEPETFERRMAFYINELDTVLEERWSRGSGKEGRSISQGA